MSFGKHVKKPLKWTSVVEVVWHDLQGGNKRLDPEALVALDLFFISITPEVISGVSGQPIFTNSTTTEPSLLSMFCSLLSIVMVITILSLCCTFHLRTQLANTLVTSLQQSI